MNYTLFHKTMKVAKLMIEIEVSNGEVKDFLLKRGINVTDNQVVVLAEKHSP